MTSEELLLRLATIVLLGVGAQWLAWRLRLPSILLLLALGLIAGPATGFLEPDKLFGDLLAPAVSLSVAVILFEGGLSLRVREVRGVGLVVRNLLVVGTAVTWLITTLFCYFAIDLSLSLSMLLGAILVVTGPTVVVPLIDMMRPVGQVKALLSWEGIVIDPIGAMLAVVVFEAIFAERVDQATAGTVLSVMKTVGLGGGIGLAGAGALIFLLRRYLIPDQLQNPMTLMTVLIAAAGADRVQSESGLLAATVMGIALANQRIVSVRHILEFKESLRVLLIGSLFIVLAARLSAHDIKSIDAVDVGLLVVLIVVARPLGVALSTLRSKLTWQERSLLAFMAPRGIVAASVASIFALRLEEQGYAGAGELVPLTFLVILGTIVVYGLAGPVVAQRLGLSRPRPQGVLIVGAHGWAREIARALQAAGVNTLLVDTNRANVREANLAGLTAHYANILSDDAIEGLDLDDIGRLLALTPNDEVNALAAQHFAARFERAEVYQLPPKTGIPRDERLGREVIPGDLRGRILFSKRATHDYLTERFSDGAIVKTTTFSDVFDYEQFKALYGEEALRLFIVLPGGGLQIITPEAEPTVRPGQTLISLVDPGSAPEERPAAVAAAKAAQSEA